MGLSTASCFDWKGNAIAEGKQFLPSKHEPCKTCMCSEGISTACSTVQCSPPECVGGLLETMDDECCKYNCIELPDHNNPIDINMTALDINPGLHPDATNLSLRLVASTVTTFLILALLMFMIHRLRQRRILIMMRQMHADHDDEDTVAYGSEINSVDIGMTFPPYEDPPPPYFPPKPPDIDDNDAPPPYQEEEDNNNHTVNGRTGNGHIPPGCPPYTETNRDGQSTSRTHSRESSSTNENPATNSNHGDTNFENPNQLPHEDDNNSNNNNDGAASNLLVVNITEIGLKSAKKNLKTNKANVQQQQCDLVASLDKNGHVHSSAASQSRRSKGNKSTPVGNKSAPKKNSADRDTPVKRRSKCPHLKKNRAAGASKSCSFKDGYSQTLPTKRTAKYDDGLMPDDSRSKENNPVMRNSYHASTSTAEELLPQGNDDTVVVLPQFDWGKIEVNHIRHAKHIKHLVSQGNETTNDTANTDVDHHNNKKEEDSVDYPVNVQYVTSLMDCLNDTLECDAINNTINGEPDCTTTANNLKDSKLYSDGNCSIIIPRSKSDGVSDESVCSETGEKRKSDNTGANMSILDSVSHNDQSNFIDPSFNQSAGSSGFDSLRDALKGVDCKSNQSAVVCNVNNMDRVSPTGTKPKVKQIIYCDPDDASASFDKNTSKHNRTEIVTADKDNKTSALYPNNCKQQKKITKEDVVVAIDTSANGSSPSALKKSKHKPSNREKYDKRKSEFYPPDVKEVGEADDIMSRSVCTAAEYGFDISGSAGIGDCHYNSKLIPQVHDKSNQCVEDANSPVDRLRREKISKKESPEAFRRISMAHDDDNQFKQYGFIDNPNSIENVDNVLREERVRAAELRNKSRSNSRERKKGGRGCSQERKPHHGDQVRTGAVGDGGTKSRNNSSERKKKRHSSYLSPRNNNEGLLESQHHHESSSPKTRPARSSKEKDYLEFDEIKKRKRKSRYSANYSSHNRKADVKEADGVVRVNEKDGIIKFDAGDNNSGAVVELKSPTKMKALSKKAEEVFKSGVNGVKLLSYNQEEAC